VPKNAVKSISFLKSTQKKQYFTVQMDIDHKEPATFWMRMLAHNIDLLPVLLPLFALQAYFDSPKWILYMLPAWYITYHLVCEIIWSKTLGKHILKLIPMTKEGIVASKFQLALRNIYKLLSISLLFLGYTLILFHPKKRGLHDILSGCSVFVNIDEKQFR